MKRMYLNSELTIERQSNGSLLLSVIDIDNNYHKKIFYGYSKRQAIILFNREFKNSK